MEGSPPLSEHIHHCIYLPFLLVRTFKFCCRRKFLLCKTVLSTVVTTSSVRSSDLPQLVTESLCTFTNLSLRPHLPAPGSHLNSSAYHPSSVFRAHHTILCLCCPFSCSWPSCFLYEEKFILVWLLINVLLSVWTTGNLLLPFLYLGPGIIHDNLPTPRSST